MQTPNLDLTLAPEDFARHRYGLGPERLRFLQGRGVWITGAGTGYGRALSVALAQCGAVVFGSGRRADKLLETRAEARRLAGLAKGAGHAGPAGAFAPLPLDVTDQAAVEQAGRAIRQAHPAPLAVVHCAGLSSLPHKPRPLTLGGMEDWEEMLRVNVQAALLATRALFPAPAPAARALFLTSEAGWADTPGHGLYNVSKAALNALCRSLAAEYADQAPGADIQINGLSPGQARTEMNQGSDISPYALAPMALLLLSHPAGGPNGRFFHRDGRHLDFCWGQAWPRPLDAQA